MKARHYEQIITSCYNCPNFQTIWDDEKEYNICYCIGKDANDYLITDLTIIQDYCPLPVVEREK